jgi:hypothetical protein
MELLDPLELLSELEKSFGGLNVIVQLAALPVFFWGSRESRAR